MVFQKNGISLRLLSADAGAQYAEDTSSMFEVKSLLFNKAESAPEKSSCHRRPSKVIIKTFSVLSFDCPAAANETATIMALKRYLIMLLF
jgi:hypothetical protein